MNYIIIILSILFIFCPFTSGNAKDKSLTLPDILVKGAPGSIVDPDKLTVPVQIITRNEIEDIGATTLANILDITLGIDLVTSPDQTISPGVQTIRMRGMDISHTLVLIDGIRLPGSFPTMQGYSFADIGNINIETIERIEVLRDGPSARYGADAVAGVVNIITRRHIDDLTVKTQYGLSSRSDGNEYQVDMANGFSMGNVYCNLSAFTSNLDHYSRDSEIPWDFPDIKKTGAGGSFNYDIGKSGLLDMVWRYSEFNRDYQYIGDDFRTTEKKDLHLGTRVRGEIDQWSYDAGIHYTKQETVYDFIGALSEAGYGDKDSTFTELHANIGYDLASWLSFVSGITYFDNKIDSSVRINKSRKTSAFFTEVALQPLHDLTLKISGRMEDSNDFGSNFSPKLSLRWEIISSLLLRASIAKSYQIPTLAQMYDDFIGVAAGGALDIYGNPHLNESEGLSVNFGFVWYLPTKFNSKLSVDIFENRIDDLIDIKVIENGSNKDYTYANLEGESTFKGIEVSFTTDLLYGLALDIKGNYLDAEDPDGNDLTNRLRTSLMTILKYRFNDQIWGNLRYNYRGRYIDDYNEIIPRFDYFSCQGNYAYSDSIVLYVGGRNIFDEKSPIDFDAQKRKIHVQGGADSSLGAFFYGGMRFKF